MVNVQHLPDGRSIADTAALAALTGRSPWAVRTLCERGDNGYDVDDCTERLEANPGVGRLLTAAQAQQYLGVPAGTVRYWASRGLLHCRGRNPRGIPLYEAARIVELRDPPNEHQ